MNASSSDPSGPFHVDYLDGWRGLAIVCLLAGHFLPVPGIDLGAVGVNLFFVLSGLLMGGLLFEKNEPIPRFYRRRIARIVPAHLAFIALVSLGYWVLGLPMNWRELLAALFFLNNYVFPDNGPGTGQMPLGHIWSLSVEEHSYILLSMVALAHRRALVNSRVAIAALLAVTMLCAVYYQWLNPPKLAYWLWLHSEVAAYGLLGSALWVSAGRPRLINAASPLVAPALLLAGVLLHWWSVPLLGQRLAGVGCFVAAIGLLTQTHGWLAFLLSWAPLRQLGLWSYSLYLWQQPFYIWTHDANGPTPVLALVLAVASGLASYYLVERPARSFLNARWRPGR